MTAYVELHCHSNFSLLDGASHPEDLVARAAELGRNCCSLITRITRARVRALTFG